MDFTNDKLRSIVRKWQSLIEASVDVKTTDGYVLRLFAIGFTRRAQNQVKKTTYAQSSQIREIRSKMVEIMRREAEGSDLKELVQKFVPESIGREIEKAAKGIYPLHNVYVRKAKILKTPKLDMSKLLETHGEAIDVSEGMAVYARGFMLTIRPTLAQRSSRAATLSSPRFSLRSRVVVGMYFMAYRSFGVTLHC